ncbi:MAG: hypothetical protein JO360_00780 [Acidobacteria bacterium]|nr:hypothetical protein [Acidobacteriota bacterium]
MKAKLCCLFLLLLCAPVCMAQNKKEKLKPDFAGTWLLDVSKGKADASDTRLETRLVIEQQESQIKFIYHNRRGDEREVVCYTDGRGEENPSFITVKTVGRSNEPKEQTPLKSKTGWEGEKLVRRGVTRQTVSGRNFTHEIVQEWKLSQDGSTLTETTRSRNPNLMMRSGQRSLGDEYTRVFHRAPDE